MKSSLGALILSLVVLGGAAIGYGFWYAQVAHVSSAVADLQHQIDTKSAVSGRVKEARAALADLKGDEAAVQSHFVSEVGVVAFINELETRARGQSATLKVLSVARGGDDQQPTLLFSLAIDGSFDAVMRSVGALEFAPYDLSISRLTVSKDDKNLWHASLELVVGSVTSTLPTTP